MSDASKVIKAFIDSISEYKPDELKLQMRALLSEVYGLEYENKHLKDKNEELRVELLRRKRLEHHDGGYYIMDDDGEEGPVCPECYTGKGFAYLLENVSRGARCSVCGNIYSGVKASVEGHRSRIC